MFSYIPHTEQDVSDMLKAIGISNIEELFSDIPPNVRLKNPLSIPEGISEFEVAERLKALAEKNKRGVSFLGCGSYDHIIPSVVRHITSKSEFYTSYTPYQAELSQGTLKAIFEFQTLICELTGLDVSNASLYDGSTAACEACSIALQERKNSHTLLVSPTVHPHTIATLRTFFRGLDVHITEIADEDGAPSLSDISSKLNDDVAACLVQTPNFFGFLEDYTEIARLVSERGALFIISANPLSLSVLKSPGEWGADIAVGDTQPLGLAPYFGGPTAGYIAAKERYLRKMPGRIVGQTTDRDGNRAFVLTLQAREQHIKRERATSNICSNQALAALATTAYLCAMGKEGVREVALQNIQKAHELARRIEGECNIPLLHKRDFFNEFSIRLPMPASDVIKAMEESGIFAGVSQERFFLKRMNDVLTIAVTEKRTKAELELYVKTLKRVTARREAQ